MDEIRSSWSGMRLTPFPTYLPTYLARYLLVWLYDTFYENGEHKVSRVLFLSAEISREKFRYSTYGR